MDVEQRHTREMTVATKHTTNQKKQKKKKTNRKRARSNMSIIVWGEKHRHATHANQAQTSQNSVAINASHMTF